MEAVKKFFITLGYAITAGIILTIIFVRPLELKGESGGQQASRIISAGAQGLASIIRAATGK